MEIRTISRAESKMNASNFRMINYKTLIKHDIRLIPKVCTNDRMKMSYARNVS